MTPKAKQSESAKKKPKPDDEFSSFEALTRRLLKVAKTEIEKPRKTD